MKNLLVSKLRSKFRVNPAEDDGLDQIIRDEVETFINNE